MSEHTTFEKPLPGDDDIKPFDRARLAAHMEREGYSYQVDSDGDVYAYFGRNRFLILGNGGGNYICTVRGQWNVAAPATARYRLLDVINNWCAHHFWPKAYLVSRDNGTVEVHTEVSIDFEHGVSDLQLKQLVDCGVGTAMQLFSELDSHFPDTRFDN